MTWESRCGNYRVQKSDNRYEKRTRYYALIKQNEVWSMVEHMKTYRTRKAAERALVTHLKKQAERSKPKSKATTRPRKRKASK